MAQADQVGVIGKGIVIRGSDDPEARARLQPVERKLKAVTSPVADR